MRLAHSEPPPPEKHPATPELPEDWLLVWDDPRASAVHRRRVLLMVLLGVALAAVVVGGVVLNAQVHYARGVAALDDGAYDLAVAEFSHARVLVMPYRDAGPLADQAQRRLSLQEAARKEAEARTDAVSAAFSAAAVALANGRAHAVDEALGAVDPADLQTVLGDDADLRQTADELTADLTAAAKRALEHYEWARAVWYASALQALDPGSDQAASFTAAAKSGQALSARLAEAKSAAQRGEWRKALRLALAVRAEHVGFPGAATLIAEARKALAPKPSPKPAATSPPPATTSGATSGTSSGSSSGSTPAPPPPP